MSIADRIPTMSDEDLASLRVNALNLATTALGLKRDAAANLLPVIDAELAARLARKPAKTTRAKAAAKPAATPAAPPAAKSAAKKPAAKKVAA